MPLEWVREETFRNSNQHYTLRRLLMQAISLIRRRNALRDSDPKTDITHIQ